MGRSERRLAFLAFVLTLGAIGVVAAPAGATGGGSHGGSSGGFSCGVYPVALKAAVVAAARPGDVIEDIANGARSGHEGWLTWTGDSSEPALAKSLTPPGDDQRYVDPDDPKDHLLSVGDWVLESPARCRVRASARRWTSSSASASSCPCGHEPRTGSKVASSRERVRERRDQVVQAQPRQQGHGQALGPTTCVAPSKALWRSPPVARRRRTSRPRSC